MFMKLNVCGKYQQIRYVNFVRWAQLLNYFAQKLLKSNSNETQVETASGGNLCTDYSTKSQLFKGFADHRGRHDQVDLLCKQETKLL